MYHGWLEQQPSAGTRHDIACMCSTSEDPCTLCDTSQGGTGQATLSAICLCWGALLTMRSTQELLDCQEDNNMGQAYEACQGTAYEAWLKSGSASLAAITMGRSGSPLARQPTQLQVRPACGCMHNKASLGSTQRSSPRKAHLEGGGQAPGASCLDMYTAECHLDLHVLQAGLRLSFRLAGNGASVPALLCYVIWACLGLVIAGRLKFNAWSPAAGPHYSRLVLVGCLCYKD